MDRDRLSAVVEEPEILFRSSTSADDVAQLRDMLSSHYSMTPKKDLRAEFARFIRAAFKVQMAGEGPCPGVAEFRDLATEVFGLRPAQWSFIVAERDKVYPFKGAAVSVNTLKSRYGAAVVEAAVQDGTLPSVTMNKGRFPQLVTGVEVASKVLGRAGVVLPKQEPSPRHRTSRAPRTQSRPLPPKKAPALVVVNTPTTLRVKTLTLNGGNLTIPNGMVLEVENLGVLGDHSILLG